MKLFKPYTYLGTKANTVDQSIYSINIFLPLPETYTVVEVNMEEVFHKRTFWGIPLKAFMITLDVDIRSKGQFDNPTTLSPPPTYIWNKELDQDLRGNTDLIVEVNAPEYAIPQKASTPVRVESHVNGFDKSQIEFTRIENAQQRRTVPPTKKVRARTVVPIRGADSVIIIS